MKSLLLFFIFFYSFNAFSAVKTTVSNGSWFDPAVWSPAGVPLMEDTVIINHDIIVQGNFVDFGASWLIVNNSASIVGDTIFSLHGNLKLYGLMNLSTIAVGDGDSTQVYGTVLGRKYIPGNPKNFNYTGLIQSDSLILGDNFENFGSIDVMTLVVGGPSCINHTGADIAVSVMATFGGPCTNQQNATMNINSLLTSENIWNDGDISCVNWTHAQGIADGQTGRFCVAVCFLNLSAIQGTLDVCDASAGGFCDMNMGTIAPTVTICQQGACAVINGIEEGTSQTVGISPNPAADVIKISLTKIDAVDIIDTYGRILISIEGSDNYLIDVSGFEKGYYFVRTTAGLNKFIVW